MKSMLQIGVIGTGYVGLVHAITMAEFGMHVVAMDIVEEKIKQLQSGLIPIYEPGLEILLMKNQKEKKIEFTTDMKKTVENSDVVFIAVGTPPQADGSADLQYVKAVAEEIGKFINKDIVIVNKSTVPVGTGKIVKAIIKEQINKRNVQYKFDVVSNPEFLREGKAVEDCLLPDRVVIGTESEFGRERMEEVYDTLIKSKVPILFTSIETAEMIKYASNAFLAVKISYINEMAMLAEKVGADIHEIARGMGLDTRISPKFLNAGPGYGGSCFPKDTQAIVEIGKEYQEDMLVIQAAIQANKNQSKKIVEKMIKVLAEKKKLKDATVGVWGLSFKPETDDMREAPSIPIIQALVKEGIHIKTYCPQGMKEAAWRLSKEQKYIEYCTDQYSAVKGVDLLVIITEWEQFKMADISKVKQLMSGDIVYDLRNIFYKDDTVMEQFEYYGVGCVKK